MNLLHKLYIGFTLLTLILVNFGQFLLEDHFYVVTAAVEGNIDY